MLYHDANPNIVVSTNSGLKQHQVSSWQIEGTELVKADGYDVHSNFVSNYINELIDYVGDEDLELFFDSLDDVALGIGIEDFYDLKALDFRKAIDLIDTLSQLDDNQKSRFKRILKKAGTDFAKEFINDKKEYIIEKKNKSLDIAGVQKKEKEG